MPVTLFKGAPSTFQKVIYEIDFNGSEFTQLNTVQFRKDFEIPSEITAWDAVDIKISYDTTITTGFGSRCSILRPIGGKLVKVSEHNFQFPNADDNTQGFYCSNKFYTDTSRVTDISITSASPLLDASDPDNYLIRNSNYLREQVEIMNGIAVGDLLNVVMSASGAQAGDAMDGINGTISFTPLLIG